MTAVREDDGGDVRLNEFDKLEWREVVRIVRPDWTDEQFDKEWDDFCEFKRRKQLQ